MAMVTRARTVTRTNDDEGEGERWRALQIRAIRAREREIKEDLVGTSKREGATVASLARRQDGNGKWANLPVLNEARRGAIYSRHDTYREVLYRTLGEPKRARGKTNEARG